MPCLKSKWSTWDEKIKIWKEALSCFGPWKIYFIYLESWKWVLDLPPEIRGITRAGWKDAQYRKKIIRFLHHHNGLIRTSPGAIPATPAYGRIRNREVIRCFLLDEFIFTCGYGNTSTLFASLGMTFLEIYHCSGFRHFCSLLSSSIPFLRVRPG